MTVRKLRGDDDAFSALLWAGMQRKHRRVGSVAVLVASTALGLLEACGAPPSSSDASELAVQDAIQTSCEQTAPTVCPMPPHYSDIAPILQRSCVPCHPGAPADGQWPLTEYADVAPWAALVQEELCTYGMPPLDGGIPMAAADRLAILDWIRCGVPE
jgi:hypothetical protein